MTVRPQHKSSGPYRVIAAAPGRSRPSPRVPPGAQGPARPRLGRGFWHLWGAASASSLGDGLAVVAFPLIAAGLTRNAALVAGVVVAQRIPWLLLSLPAGALADRLPRGRTMVSIDVIRMAILVVLGVVVAAGGATLPLLYGAAFLLGALETVFSAAAHAALPALVDDDQVDQGNGYLFASQTAGESLVGPAAGGALFAVSASVPLLADAVSFFVSAVLLRRVKDRLPAPAVVGPRPSLMADMRSGLRFFRTSPLLRLLAVIVGGLAFCQAVVMGVLVLFAQDVLHLGAGGYGLFLGLGAIGNVVGALAASRVKDRFGTSPVLTGGALAAALAYLVVASTSSAAVATLMFVVEAFAVACGTVVTISLRQACVPDELRGRVGNVFRMFVFGAIPVGAVVGGVLAETFGLRTPILVAGLAQASLALLTAPALRAAVGRPAVAPKPTVALAPAA